MKVDIYYNLHRHCWSVVAREGADRGRVVAHLPRAVVADATLVVREGGRLRALQERRKNVHAFVRGRLLAEGVEMPEGLRPISYNPFEAGYFTLRDDAARPPVRQAALVVLDGRRALALDPRP